MPTLDSVEALKQNVEFIRSKHKLKETLTFEEICEAISILHDAQREDNSEYVQEVARKNIPYLKKLFKKVAKDTYKKAQAQLFDMTSVEVILNDKVFSGITDFKVAVVDEELVVVLNSDIDSNYTLRVPISDNTLNDNELDQRDQMYIADLIDIDEVIRILKNNNIEYLHIVKNGVYQMIDNWDSMRSD